MDQTGTDQTGTDHPSSWRRTVDRAVMACGVFVMSVQLVVCLAALAHVGGAAPGVVAALLVVVVVDLLILGLGVDGIVRPVRRRRPVTTVCAAALALVAVVAASRFPTDGDGTALAIVPVNTAQAAQVVALGLVLNPWAAAGLVLLTGVVFVPLRAAVAGTALPTAVDEWILPAVTSLGVLAVVHHLRRQADLADQLAAVAATEESARSEQTNLLLARDEARRLLHDEVISALRAVELGLEPGPVRRAAAAALGSLRGASRLTTLQALQDGLRGDTRIDLRFHAGRWHRSPPPRILTAMTGAAAEALRNADRHGHASAADITLLSDSEHTSIEVVDDGTGLSPGWRPGFGIDESVVGRMRQVGGEATVGPSDGGGTRVHLRWPAEVGRLERTAGPLSPADRAVLWPLATACAVTTVYLCVRFPGPEPIAGAAVAVGVLLTLLLVVRRIGLLRTAGEPLGAGPVVITGAAVCALTWAGLQVAGGSALLDVRSWVVGGAANVVAVLAFEAPVRRVVPVIVAQVMVVLVAAVRDPFVSAADPLGALATPVVVGGLGLVLGAALRHGERRTLLARAELVRRRELVGWADSRTQSRRVHLEHLEDDVVPYLRRVAGGEAVDPAEATLLSLRCRDALYLDEPLDVRTRNEVQAARRAGVDVVIRPGEHDGEHTWPLLRSVLGVVDRGARLTVLPDDPSVGQTGRIVVVPPVAVAPAGLSDGVHVHDGVRSTFHVARRDVLRSED